MPRCIVAQFDRLPFVGRPSPARKILCFFIVPGRGIWLTYLVNNAQLSRFHDIPNNHSCSPCTTDWWGHDPHHERSRCKSHAVVLTLVSPVLCRIPTIFHELFTQSTEVWGDNLTSLMSNRNRGIALETIIEQLFSSVQDRRVLVDKIAMLDNLEIMSWELERT